MLKRNDLYTPVEVEDQKIKIRNDSKILTLGSCFSDNIGYQLERYKFISLVNPFGTVFNPISLAKLLEMGINNEQVELADLEFFTDRYFHYDFHTSFDDVDGEKVIEKINAAIAKVHTFIENTDYLMLTFGTSIAYELIENDRLVSNCHKVPNSKFHKTFLSISDMESRMKEAISLFRKLNPMVEIVLTVSPVRHTKEGLVSNSLSKARLIQLCHNLCEWEEQISYFPAYEIMVDELRDYRYYTSDMIHPNDIAVNMIWNKFVFTYFSEESVRKINDFSSLNASRDHRPFNPNSPEHVKFKASQREKIEKLVLKYPEVNFEDYKSHFKNEN